MQAFQINVTVPNPLAGEDGQPKRLEDTMIVEAENRKDAEKRALTAFGAGAKLSESGFEVPMSFAPES